MGSSITSQNTHPLTAVVGKDETIRDRIGHLVVDARGDREFRFVKMRGGQTASQGMPVLAYKLSADEDTLYEMTVDAASVPTIPNRDLAGIFVGQSTCVSGAHGWIMTKGRLGKVPGSHYPDTVFALTSQTTAAGDQCALSSPSVSTFKWLATTSAYVSVQGLSVHPRISLLAYSTDTGDKITRGKFASPHFHGGLNLPPNA